MEIYQLKLRMYMLEDVESAYILNKISNLLDSVLAQDPEMLEFHGENTYKYYCFNMPFPLENDKIYRKDRLYSVTLRMVNIKLAKYFSEKLPFASSTTMKGLVIEQRVIPQKFLECVYTITPVLLKDNKGYWRTHMSVEEYENRIKSNLIKKWNTYFHTKIDESFELIERLEFLNQKPVGFCVKNHTLLGDKVCIYVAKNKSAQDLMHFALAAGLLEGGARGAGFINYRWL